MSDRVIEAVLRMSAKLGSLSAFDRMSSKLDQVDRKAKAFNRSQSAITRAATMADGALMRFAAPAAAGYLGARVVRDFAQTERSLTRIGLTLGASRGDMRGLQQDIERYASKYALQSDQVMETVGAYAAAGAEIADIRADLGLLTKAQQAIDASGQDTVNTWDAARKSLGLATSDAQRFFEIVAAGGAAGKFEAKDMAQYLPSLLPSAAKQGFEGTEGAKRVVGFLEVMADYTGSAGQAATAVGDFLEKLSSPDVEKRLGEISGSFAKRMKEARDHGGDMLKVVHQILKEATGNDASRLGQIFGDKEARAAATVVLTKMDQILVAQDKIAANAPGILDRNNAEVLADTQAKLDRLYDTVTRLSRTSGELVVNIGGADAIDAVSKDLQRLNAALKAGWSPTDSLKAVVTGRSPSDVVDAFAWRGGYRSPEEMKLIEGYARFAKSRQAEPTREPTFGFRMDNGVPVPVARDNRDFAREPSYGFRMDANGVPVPDKAPAAPVDREVYVPFERLVGPPKDLMTPADRGRAVDPMIGSGAVSDPNYDEFLRAATAGREELAQGGAEAAQGFAQTATDFLSGAMQSLGSALGQAAAQTFNSNAKVTIAPNILNALKPRADTGVSQAGGPR